MQITISSTTDSPENVQAALGNKAPAKTEPAKDEGGKKPDQSATPKEEPEAAAKSDPAETEDASETDEAEEVEAGDGSDPEAEKDDKPRKKGGWQKRIDKKTREAADARREADFWKSQALKGAAGGKPQSQETDKPKTEAAGKPNADSYQTPSEFYEALADWKADQKLQEYEKKQQAKAQEGQQSQAIKAHFDRVEAFKKQTADYDDVISEAGDLPLSGAIQELVISSDHGPALIYELAKNTEELDRLNRLSPLAAAREVGKLEARLAKPSEEKKPNKQTKAPKPLDPVGGKGAAVDKDIYDTSLTQKEYEKARAKQRAEAAKAG